MKKLIFLIFLLSYQISHSQLPIGKDLNLGKKEIKSVLKKYGFNYLKEQSGKNYWNLIYKEEFTVSIHSNLFENINSINIATGNDKIITKIKKIVNYQNWQYDYTEKDRFSGKDLVVFKIHDYKARYFYKKGSDYDPDSKHLEHQFILFNEN
ncbi:hypothetical protein EGM88_15685 [Aureibaculum marinum]|uniref:Uncharacterized protein n=2 Tax=Pseudomonadati TaxID=3379134 RepID=A0A3N4NA03_9FLAO|nr:hypothetical protein [Aureibaculum marinum]RPD90366.1 hypothetical protein EGM88_15685 [Aureibaculum marinum]